MCIVHNTIGSLTFIKSHLRDHNLNDFNSLNELINFQKNFTDTQQQIISDHSRLIEQEKSNLEEEIVQLNALIEKRKFEVEQQLKSDLIQLNHTLDNLPSTPSNIFQTFIVYLRKIWIKRKIRNIENSFDSEIRYSLQEYNDLLAIKSDRYQYIVSNFIDAVNENSLSQLQELKRKKRIIDEINTSIYGALGEQKVEKELKNLPDDYILINDYSCSFHPAIYNRQENDYIKSIQIDHLLISPAGVFLIETKNWSEQSLNNLSLRSPVEQIRRTSFALFKILAGEITNSKLTLNKHHWGDRKVPIRNLIVLINHKPIEEFQFVKILTLKELRNYVEYFKPCLSNNETQKIAHYLLRING